MHSTFSPALEIFNIDCGARKKEEGNHVSMREQRVLYTHLLARACTKLCDTVDFYHVASKVGNNLAADGSRNNLTKIEGLDSYSFKADDARWGITKACPNPTPKEAAKAKAYALAYATRGPCWVTNKTPRTRSLRAMASLMAR